MRGARLLAEKWLRHRPTPSKRSQCCATFPAKSHLGPRVGTLISISFPRAGALLVQDSWELRSARVLVRRGMLNPQAPPDLS